MSIPHHLRRPQVPPPPPPLRVYLAGPMTDLPQLNHPTFHAHAARLREAGYEVVNPAEINLDPTAGWHACMRADIAHLVTCQAIALLPGWAGSRGASLERFIASTVGLHVAEVHEYHVRP